MTSRGFKRLQQKLKLPPMGIKLTTDHHWFRSLTLIQLCQPDICVMNRNFVSCTTSLFGLGSFLDSVEHDFTRIWTYHKLIFSDNLTCASWGIFQLSFVHTPFASWTEMVNFLQTHKIDNNGIIYHIVSLTFYTCHLFTVELKYKRIMNVSVTWHGILSYGNHKECQDPNHIR